MRAFAAGETDVLVATTVIEVGIDVAQRDRDGDRGRRALRRLPAAPAARPGRARRASLAVLAVRRRGGRDWRGGGCGRWRRSATASSSPRSTSACAARARSSAPARSGLPRFAVAELPEDAPTLLAARDEVLALLRAPRLARRSRPRPAARRRPPPLRRRRRRPDPALGPPGHALRPFGGIPRQRTNARRLRMRVIAGELQGQSLVAPRGWKVRPTSDRVREAIFSALGERVDGRRRPRPLLRHRRAGDRGALARCRRARSWSTATPGRRSATSSGSGWASAPSWSAPTSGAGSGQVSAAAAGGEVRSRLRRRPL